MQLEYNPTTRIIQSRYNVGAIRIQLWYIVVQYGYNNNTITLQQ